MSHLSGKHQSVTEKVPADLQSTLVFIDTSIALTSGSRIGQAFAPAILEMAARNKLQAVSDSLVFQEVEDWAPLQTGQIFRMVVKHVLEVRQEDWKAASKLAAQYPSCSPRVCLHTAVMHRNDIQYLYAVSGTGYDGLPDICSLPLYTIAS